MKEVFLLSFTGIYLAESFYREYPHVLYDLSDIEGTFSICSKDAEEKLQKRLRDIPVSAIRFLDSGSYHYVSLFFIERIPVDFVLIVFDHHTDMETDDLKDFLTCGNWINHIKNPHLKKIIEVGPLDAEKESYVSVSDERLLHADSLKEARFLTFDLPVYVSLDKDCLSEDVIRTDWDQGILSEDSLLKAVDDIYDADQVLGFDVCGECRNELKYISEIRKDDSLNQDILKKLEKK